MNIGRQLKKIATPLFRSSRRMSALYIHLRGTKSLLVKPKRTPEGYFLVGNDDMVTGNYEPTETRFVERILEDVDCFVNIGANSGYYCAKALARNIPTIAFEPVPQNLFMLYNTVIANGWQDRIEIHPVALSDTTGLIDIHGFGTGASIVTSDSGTDPFSLWVPTNTLNNLIGQRLQSRRALVLMDVEGAENRILSAASFLLEQRPRPFWIIEIIARSDGAPHREETLSSLLAPFRIFRKAGYQAFSLKAPHRAVEEQELIDRFHSGTLSAIGPNYLFSDPDCDLATYFGPIERS